MASRFFQTLYVLVPPFSHTHTHTHTHTLTHSHPLTHALVQVVEVWKGDGWNETMSRVTKGGYHSVLSAPFYLNYISYGEDWRNYYTVEPTDFDAPSAGAYMRMCMCMCTFSHILVACLLHSGSRLGSDFVSLWRLWPCRKGPACERRGGMHVV